MANLRLSLRFQQLIRIRRLLHSHHRPDRVRRIPSRIVGVPLRAKTIDRFRIGPRQLQALTQPRHIVWICNKRPTEARQLYQVLLHHRPIAFRRKTALRENRVSAFPVIDDDGKVIGVVSEADMLARKVLSTGMLHRGEQEKPEDLTAGDLMTHPAITVSPEDSAEVAARLMYTLQVKRLPVIDPSGRLAGIISRTDVLATFDRSDEQIRKEVTDDVIWHELGVGRASSR